MDYRQNNPADHVVNSEILKVLGIAAEVPENEATNSDQQQQ